MVYNLFESYWGAEIPSLPEIAEDLDAIKSKSINLKFLGEIQIDSRGILNNYDISAINTSLFKYCESVKNLCTDLISRINFFEDNNKDVLYKIKKHESNLSEEYKNDSRLSDQENAIIHQIHCKIRNNGNIDFERNKELLKSISTYVDNLKSRLDNATMNDGLFEELAKIEAEPRPSFTLLVEAIVKRFNLLFDNLNAFSSKHECFAYLSSEFEKIIAEHIERSTSKRLEYINKCKKEYIDSDISQKWINEIKVISISRLKAFSSIVDYCLTNIATLDDDYLYEDLCDLLSLHTKEVDNFYDNQRIGIYQNNAFSSYSEALDKIETEKKLYEATSEFRAGIIDLINDVSEAESRIIINCTNELCDMPLVQLLEVKSSDFGSRISQETFAMLDKLRYDNYDTMKNDAKTFAEAQERRDKEFNSLLFRMKKELERG